MNSAYEKMLPSLRMYTMKTIQLTIDFFRSSKDIPDALNALLTDRSWTWHNDEPGSLVGFRDLMNEPEATMTLKSLAFPLRTLPRIWTMALVGLLLAQRWVRFQSSAAMEFYELLSSHLRKYQLIETDRTRHPEESLMEIKCGNGPGGKISLTCPTTA